MPRLSCITTVYNDGPALFTAVNAMLSQSFDDFEFLIVDDGSGPETKALLKTLNDPRIRLIEQANDGLSSARNVALRQARGDYICFLDADDSRPDWALAAIVEQLDREQPDLLLCPGIFSPENGAPLQFFDIAIFERLRQMLLKDQATAQHPEAEVIWSLAQLIEPQSANKVVRRTMVDRFGLRFPDTHFFEDIFFHTTALAAAERLSFAPSPCFTYRRRYGRPQITADHGLRRFEQIAVTRLTLDSPASSRWMKRRLYRSAVLAACLKLAEWCEHSVSHVHKANFNQALRNVMSMIDPQYRDFDRDGLLSLGVPVFGLNYSTDMTHA